MARSIRPHRCISQAASCRARSHDLRSSGPPQRHAVGDGVRRPLFRIFPLPTGRRRPRNARALERTPALWGNRAFYDEGADLVQMPRFECFRDAESYLPPVTFAHELTHNADIGITITGPKMRAAWRGILGASASATKAMPAKNWAPNWGSVPVGRSRHRARSARGPRHLHFPLA